MVHNGLGNGPGGHMQRLGPRHGKGGGVIPVGGVLGNLNSGLYLRPGGQGPRGGGSLIGRLGQSGHLVFGGLDHICHVISPFLCCKTYVM